MLHNVMPPGFRGMSDAGAAIGLYKTPPLCGIEDTAPYMHDGRASSLNDSILAHFGDAALSSAAQALLANADKTALIKFLRDL